MLSIGTPQLLTILQKNMKRSVPLPTDLGPVVQSGVSLMSSIRVISLTVLEDSIYNILIFFAEKMRVASLGGSVGCAVRLETRRSRVQPPSRSATFVEIDHEIFSTVILSLPLIQEGQLSVSGERMCTILVNRLED